MNHLSANYSKILQPQKDKIFRMSDPRALKKYVLKESKNNQLNQCDDEK